MTLLAPTHIFAGNRLDRAGERRGDPAWLAAQLNDPRARALALWNGTALLAGKAGAAVSAAWLDGDLALRLAGDPDRLLFLGLSPDGPVLALGLEGTADPAEGPLRGHGHFGDLRSVSGLLPAEEVNLLGTARSLLEWRRKHRFCSTCGQESRSADGGWKRLCPACGAQHFPRVDPCVIMLPIHGERCLVGRQAAWAPGRYSALAGFVEPGESVEEACAREVGEEAGLTVVGVRYRSSQPWPFPSNLMIGLWATTADDRAQPDMTELEAVRWLTRREARDMVDGRLEGCTAAPPAAIAYHLIRDWAYGED